MRTETKDQPNPITDRPCGHHAFDVEPCDVPEGEEAHCTACGRKVVPTFWVAPEGSPWLVLETIGMVEYNLRWSETDDVWQLRRVFLTPDEIEALPEHTGF